MNIDIELVKKIVISAAKTEVLPKFNAIARSYKPDGSIVTEADLATQHKIETELKRHYPDIPLLGEEITPEQQQALLNSDQALWCLDPIDGTSNFAAGLPFFCISLALICQGETVAAIVYDPVREECFTAQSGQGAYLNQQALHAKQIDLTLNRTLAFIDFKRLPPSLTTALIHQRPYGSQRSLGTIALELCWIAAGRGHLYLHDQQLLWDYAAAQLILTEAGAQSCTLSGEALTVNSLQPQSTLAAADDQLFEQWRDYLKAHQVL